MINWLIKKRGEKVKKIKMGFIGLISIIMLVACGRVNRENDMQGMKIVTSFYPIYAITKEVSGELNDVRMIQSGKGIHSFEPSASDVQAIYDADLFLYHSHILESWAGSLSLDQANSTLEIVETSKGLDLQRVEGLENIEVHEGMDTSSLYDPHSWLDPVLIGDQAYIIADKLADLDPQNGKTYRENARRLKEKLEQLTADYQEIFSTCSQKTFVTQHTAFAYLAKRFGLKQLGVLGLAEEEPSPRQLGEIVAFIKENKVKTVFVEKNMSTKMAKTLQDATGVKLKTLDPLEADPGDNRSFVEHLEENLSLLARELK